MSNGSINGILRIVTHPGIFHADEVCAVGWLRLMGVDAPVERRVPTSEDLANPEVLVLDIGGVHNPSLRNFDHHQKGGAGERWDSGVPYACFGLAYDAFQPGSPSVSQRFLDRIVLPVDAADTGFSPRLWAEVWVNDTGYLEGIQRAQWGTKEPSVSAPYMNWYPVPESNRPHQLSFSAVVSGFNPLGTVPAATRDAAFERAVEWVVPVLKAALDEAAEFTNARKSVIEAESVGGVLVLEAFSPWGEHVFERPDQAALLYVLFPSERGGWMVQQIPVRAGSFEGRKPLPEAWAGLRDQAFRDVTGVDDATFCHPGRFCGGAESKAGALALAELAIRA